VNSSATRKDDIIDGVDKEIIQALQIDPRAGFNRVAEVLGMSEQTVARRYRRLRGEGLLRVIGLVDPRFIGQSEWMVRLSCRPGGVARLADALARRDDVSWVTLSAGGSEIICSIRSRTVEQRDDLLLQRLPATSQVLSMTVHVVLHRYVGGQSADWEGYGATLTPDQVQALRLPPPAAPGGTVPVALEPADEPLVDALAADGRCSYAALATASGMTQGRVTRRLEALRRAGIIYFDVDLATQLMGFATSASLWLAVEPACLAAAGEQIAAHREVPFAAAITGPANLTATVICRDTDDLYEYVTTRVSAIPGVRQLEISPMLRRAKQAGARMPFPSWPPPPSAPVSRAGPGRSAAG
jgi:DNA-binding Lrp family transcriptional regulator